MTLPAYSSLLRSPLLALAVVGWLLITAGYAGAQAPRAGDAAAAAKQPGNESANLLAIGQRIYREGMRPSGQPLTGIGPVQAARGGKDAACAACHRRSGYGASEGKFVIRPIIAPALLQEQTVAVTAPRIKARLGVSQRPPYTDVTLARAIRGGVDAAGKPLDPVMPRYALNDEEMKALTVTLWGEPTREDRHDTCNRQVCVPWPPSRGASCLAGRSRAPVAQFQSRTGAHGRSSARKAIAPRS